MAWSDPGRRSLLVVLGTDLKVSLGNGVEAGIFGVASALSVSSFLAQISDAVIVVRPNSRPALGIMAGFNTADEVRVATLRKLLPIELASLHYVDYGQAERDSEELAARLLDRFGRDALRDFHFVAIPRGGLIVLGMLSYLLHLDPKQLEAPDDPQAPVVVVDDCAFSGSRFGRFLHNSSASRSVVFAHLYSHPDLRAAIEAEESRVLACVAARDLHDRAPELLGDGYLRWKESWWERPSGPRYWFGRPELVCFPWNEPDGAFWDHTEERMERTWRLVPPEYCLKNRPGPDMEPIPIQVQPEGKGPLRSSDRCLWGRLDGRILIADVDTGESFGLEGVGADMWRTLIAHGTERAAVGELRELYQADEGKLETDLHRFVMDLTRRGLLESLTPQERQ